MLQLGEVFLIRLVDRGVLLLEGVELLLHAVVRHVDLFDLLQVLLYKLTRLLLELPFLFEALIQNSSFLFGFHYFEPQYFVFFDQHCIFLCQLPVLLDTGRLYIFLSDQLVFEVLVFRLFPLQL